MTDVNLSLHDLSQLVVMHAQNGESKDAIVKVLVARGWPEVSAVRFVTMTLIEQQGRSARTDTPEEEQQPANQSFSNPQEPWRILLLVALITALFIACMLFAFAH